MELCDEAIVVVYLTAARHRAAVYRTMGEAVYRRFISGLHGTCSSVGEVGSGWLKLMLLL